MHHTRVISYSSTQWQQGVTQTSSNLHNIYCSTHHTLQHDMQVTCEQTSRCAPYMHGVRARSTLLATVILIIVSNKTFNLLYNSHLCLFSNEPVCPFLFQVQMFLGFPVPRWPFIQETTVLVPCALLLVHLSGHVFW